MGDKVVSITGNGNRVVGRDSITLNIQGEHKPLAGYLTSAQRKQLNAIVQEIEARHGESGAKIWKRVVHIPFGVDKVADIPLAQYAAVEKALQDFAHALTLVEKLNTVAQHKHASKQVAQYALEQFGVYDLKYLKPPELKHVLDYLNALPPPDFGLPFTAKPIGASHRKPVSHRVKTRGFKRWWRLMECLALRWPGHVVAIALTSAIAGKVFL